MNAVAPANAEVLDRDLAVLRSRAASWAQLALTEKIEYLRRNPRSQA